MNSLSKTDWRAIRQRIYDGKCTPIFSDRIYSHLLPNYDELPRAWADDIEYPIEHRLTFNRLAEYLSVKIGDSAAKEQFLTFIKAFFIAKKLGQPCDFVIDKYGRNLSANTLSTITKKMGIFPTNGRATQNPLAVLAELDIPIYLTTSFFNFVELALRQKGKYPQSDLCLWNDVNRNPSKLQSSDLIRRVWQLMNQYFNLNELQELCLELNVEYENLVGDTKSSKMRELIQLLNRHHDLPKLLNYLRTERPGVQWPDIGDAPSGSTALAWSSIFDRDTTYIPSSERPLVYHLFGLETHPTSMVLTENNFLDFLVRISQRKELIHPVVAETLSDSSLLLVGYKIYDWDFKALFRGLISQRRNSRREISIAIQLDAAQYSPAALAFLEKYFNDIEFKVFWGSTQAFLTQLNGRPFDGRGRSA